MANFTPSPLKPYFWKIDFRHLQMVLSFVPMICWAAAGYTIFERAAGRWSFTVAGLCFLIAGAWIRRSFAMNYSLAMRARFAPLAGEPAVDYLLFEAETPETVQKLKWVPEDAGFLSVEDGAFRVTTLRYDVQVPFAMLRCGPILKDGTMYALLVSFEAPEGPGSMRFAAVFKYFGKDLQIAGKRDQRCQWALRVIEGMKPEELRSGVDACPPPLPAAYCR